MFKILVADDEDVIRKGIITILKRELQEEVCFYEAENGIEALKICNEQYPQLAITDIRMPFCDGLNFIKNVIETGHAPTFIILSGYADFEYAKTAIKLGVKEYVLKPIKKQELVTMVDGYIKSLQSEKQRIDEKFLRESENKKVAENIKQKLLKSLLNSENTEEAKKIQEELYNLGIRFNKSLLLSSMVQFQVNEENKEYIDFAVKNIADEVLSQEAGSGFLLSVPYDSGRIVVLLEGVKRENLLLAAKNILSKVCSLVRKYLHIDIFAGVGDVVFGPTILYKSFRSACDAAGFRLYGTAKNVQLFSEFPFGMKYEQEDIGLLIQSLEDIKPAEVVNVFERLMNLAPSPQALSVIENCYTQLIKTVEGQLKKYNAAKIENLIKPLAFYELWSFLQLKQEVVRYLDQIHEIACEAKIDVSNKKLIIEVLNYVRENATSDINLNIVAEKFDRTSAYMSALFKKGTGMGFNDYITSIRMDMAKRLLADSAIPIGEVSGLCGYLNSKYFSVVFKNTFGMSPANYRQNTLNEG